mmetsp:Transcript_22581/g.62373  ORF Transcript_22581/g.62373 Transcript_22581/m.62373 type:complete len:209 (-) Transcript_22581:1332-1958(-)
MLAAPRFCPLVSAGPALAVSVSPPARRADSSVFSSSASTSMPLISAAKLGNPLARPAGLKGSELARARSRRACNFNTGALLTPKDCNRSNAASASWTLPSFSFKSARPSKHQDTPVVQSKVSGQPVQAASMLSNKASTLAKSPSRWYRATEVARRAGLPARGPRPPAWPASLDTEAALDNRSAPLRASPHSKASWACASSRCTTEWGA